MGNIYLIGMMGSGKSVTAKELASELHLQSVDLDAVIEKKMGFSIAEAFAQHGEDYFRSLEIEALKEVSEKSNTVIATGGGVILCPENIDRMKETGLIIYLETEFMTLWNRVRENVNRPLLKGDAPQDRLERILNERKGIYRDVSHLSVKTDGLTAKEVALNIVKAMKENEKN